MVKERSPFFPGRPVSIDYFVGRTNEISRIERAIKQATFGRNENIFLTGERGIGKSSLTIAALSVAEKTFNFTSAYCELSSAKNVDEMCRIIFLRLLEKSAEQGFLDKVKGIFGKYIKKIEPSLFGIKLSIDFSNDEKDLKELRLDFLRFLINFYETMKTAKPETKGIFIALDNLNGIAKLPELAHFLKGLVDEIASLQNELKFPFLLMLIGLEERMTEMQNNQPSLPRIFDVVRLTPMNEKESTEFFNKAFSSVETKVDATAMDRLVRFSSGLPVLLHEIGDAVFWYDSDNVISPDDSVGGIVAAADNIGRKYLERQVYEQVRSGTYRTILQKISKIFLAPIKRNEVLKSMSSTEIKNFDNFIRKMRGMGILKPGNRGEYLFTNDLYAAYFFLQTIQPDK